MGAAASLDSGRDMASSGQADSAAEIGTSNTKIPWSATGRPAKVGLSGG